MIRRTALAALFAAAAAPARADLIDRLFAPRASLWPFWAADDPAATLRVDHAPWSRFLAAWRVEGADGIARIAYGRVAAADRAALDGYVAALAAVPVRRLARAEQFAYWVNLYNALTVQLVLRHYPVRSIRDIDISPGLFARGPWERKLATIEGQPVSLNDIEHRILRPIWRDPRVHYALNCASLGCPDIGRAALPADGTDAWLDGAARAYVNHPRGVSAGPDGLTVSSIYEWFRADFGGSERAVIEHVRRYAAPALARRLAGVPAIARTAYDWSLNDAR